jgi:hypothetical protein
LHSVSPACDDGATTLTPHRSPGNAERQSNRTTGMTEIAIQNSII